MKIVPTGESQVKIFEIFPPNLNVLVILFFQEISEDSQLFRCKPERGFKATHEYFQLLWFKVIGIHVPDYIPKSSVLLQRFLQLG